MIQPILALFFSLFIYFTLSYLSMVSIVNNTQIHNYFNLPTSPASMVISNVIPIVSVLYRAYISLHQKIYVYRISLLYLLKGIVQFVTIVPDVTGVDKCVNRTVVDMIIFGNCADMMFSGHTGITLLTAPCQLRGIATTVVGVTLVLGRQHYISDVIMAVIVSRWIEYVVQDNDNLLFDRNKKMSSRVKNTYKEVGSV